MIGNFALEPPPDGPTKRSYAAAGFPATPGTGPSGETCATCGRCVKLTCRGANFYKCELLRVHWTRSPKTDIKLSSPACVKFMKKEIPNGGGRDL